MSAPRPVTDWLEDFDPDDRRWIDDPYALWAEMRETGEVATTRRYGGVCCPLSWVGVSRAAYDPDAFSSRHVELRESRLPPDFAPPLTSDPPHHRPARALLSGHLSASRVAALESQARLDCRALIRAFERAGAIDAVAGFARPAVSRTLARVLGMAANDIVSFQDSPLEVRLALIASAVAAARTAPGPGLVPHLVRASQAHDGTGEARLFGQIYLLLIASLDTTAAVISAALLHLAEHADDQTRLRGHPERTGRAVEEFLRVSAPVSTARVATRDTELQGRLIASGEKVLLAFGAANRDPSRFADPDRVMLDRPLASHAAFGFGIHHCAGSKLARMLIGVTIEEWLGGIADFRRGDAAPLVWTAGNVRALRTLPLAWGASDAGEPRPPLIRSDAPCPSSRPLRTVG